MNEMTLNDLTPEIMKELERLKTIDEMKEYCRREGYDLSDELAERIKDQLEKCREISDDEASATSGGACPDMVDGHYPRFHYSC